MSSLLIFFASSRVLPLAKSVIMLEVAIAATQPNVFTPMSLMLQKKGFIALLEKSSFHICPVSLVSRLFSFHKPIVAQINL